jgi:lipoate-protein ligase A
MSAPMPFQMALDEVLFRSLIEKRLPPAPILRFYFSSEPWMTVGYSHPKEQAAGPVPMCRRITGGGRVLHGEDLIFSLSGRKEDDDSFGSVRISYWKIHEAVKAGYEALGQMPEFYRCDEKLPRGGDCFTFPIATDLGLDGRKIAGGAQKRSSGVFLHQESLQLTPSLNAENLAAALRVSFEKVFGVQIENMACEPEQLKEAKDLAKTKYDSQESMVTA